MDSEIGKKGKLSLGASNRMLILEDTMLLGGLWVATGKISIKIAILDLNECVAGSNPPQKFCLVICIERFGYL